MELMSVLQGREVRQSLELRSGTTTDGLHIPAGASVLFCNLECGRFASRVALVQAILQGQTF